MLGYLYTLLQKLFNFPDLKQIGEGFSQSVNERLKKIERKIFIYFIILLIWQTLGFIFVYGCLESGFHWKYLFQI